MIVVGGSNKNAGYIQNIALSLPFIIFNFNNLGKSNKSKNQAIQGR